ncbi:hypothetical protein [Vibrio hepatarius]|uniref:hypothetical protein n=1 Tax=Vibrio hepatarius TaxID=171383 RepID=UPI0037357AB1
MNMNKTILAALISTAFSSNVLAQKVDIEQANLATEQTIQSQMESIDTATMAKLNAQNSKIAELDGTVYQQDKSGMWKAIGGGALGLTAALFSGSSNGGNSHTPDNDFPIVDNDTPGLPGVDNDIPRDINLITHGDTAYMYVNGEAVRTATLDVTSEGNYSITGSEGATFHVTGNDVLVTMVNGENVKLHNVSRTDDRNISFSVEGENYNLHRTYNGEVWVQKEQGNGTGNWATVKTGADVLANIQERQLLNAIDKTLPDVDNKPITPDINGGEGAQELKIVDGGIFLGGEKIGFIASDGNVNLYEKGKVGSVTATSGGGNISQITLNGGQTIDIARNQGNAMKTTISANNGSKIVIDHSDGSITTVKPRPEVDKPEFELPSFERVSVGEIEVDKDNQAIKVNGEWFYATVGDELVTIDGKRILLSKDEYNNITLHSAQGDLLATVHAAKIVGGKVRLVEHADSSRTYIGEQGRTITIDANKKKALQAKASKIKAKVKLSK